MELLDPIWSEHGVMPVPTLVSSDPPDHTFHRSLVEDERSADHPDLKVIGTILDQDMDNPIEIQKGVKAAKPDRAFMRLGHYIRCNPCEQTRSALPEQRAVIVSGTGARVCVAPSLGSELRLSS